MSLRRDRGVRLFATCVALSALSFARAASAQGTPPDIAQIALGADHACVRTTDGHVFCWGSNDSRQLGSSRRGVEMRPVPVAGLENVVDLAAGNETTCAVLRDGTARCWGGMNMYRPDRVDPLASPVPDVAGATRIAVGYAHACAVVTDGQVRCWGHDSEGELGDGRRREGDWLQVLVPGIRGATQVTAAYEHSCALLGDGTVRCWGGDIGSASRRPAPVRGVRNATQLVSGRDFTCALLRDGAVQCWGRANGVIAPERYDRRIDEAFPLRAPVIVVNATQGATDIAAARGSLCAVLRDGSVACSGRVAGVFGQGLLAIRVLDHGTPSTRVAVREEGACAVGVDHAVRCWGENRTGALGLGDEEGPTPVAGLADAVAITGGASHACAIRRDSGVACWGENGAGQLGDGTTTNAFSAVRVAGLTGAVELAVGSMHTCARLREGSVVCWGSNAVGQIGDRTTVNRSSPTPVAGLTGVAQIVARNTTTCARMNDGSVRCWGGNEHGLLHRGLQVSSSTTPIEVTGVTNAEEIALANQTGCARLRGGDVACWGEWVATHGGEPMGVRLTMEPQLRGATALSGGSTSWSLAFRMSDGTFRTFRSEGTFGTIDWARTAVHVAMGSGFLCSIRSSDGAVLCGGVNQGGQLGVPPGPDTQQLAEVPGLSHAIQLATGSAYACAVFADGTARCWGSGAIRNSIGTTGEPVSTPTPVHWPQR